MKITVRPPCRVGSTPCSESSAGIVHLHALLWLVLRIDDWGVSRSAHLHLLRSIDEGDEAGGWRRVDMTSHPLCRMESGEMPPIPGWVECDLREWADGFGIVIYRAPELGLVSEVGESEEDFRHRLRGLLRPEVQRQLETQPAGTQRRLFRRRTEAASGGQENRQQLAEAVSNLMGEVERRQAGSLAELTRSVELGILVVPEDLRFAHHPRRERMIG